MALLLCALPVTATTVVVIITTNGIVVASDSQVGFSNFDEPTSFKTQKDHRKLFVVNDRIVVGLIGIESLNNPTFHYEFLTWMKALQSQFSTDVSVDDVAGAIERESPTAFVNFLKFAIKQGAFHRPSPDQFCLDVASFVIVGYQDGLPHMYEVHFNVDWDNNRLIGPIKLLRDHQAVDAGEYRMYSLGVNDAITNIGNRKSYAYHQALRLSPKAVASLVDHSGVYPSLNDTITFSRALIQIEESTNPNQVGGAVNIVKILPSGRAYEVVTKPPALPKSHSDGKAKK